MQWSGVIIFGLTYMLLSWRHPPWGLQRPLIALLGAVACVAAQVLSAEQALAAVDRATLVLLCGMMGMGAALERDGLFEWLENVLVAKVSSAHGLLAAVVWGAGGLAALITNDAVCVLLAPLLVRLIGRLALPPAPFLLALATASNSGSVATLVGNPQNMLCANLGHLDYLDYAVTMTPVAVVALALNHALLAWLFRNPLRAVRWSGVAVTLTDGGLRRLGSFLVIVGTVIAYSLGADLAWSALAGWLLCLLLRRSEQQRNWQAINWPLLGFFAGLFVVVEGFSQAGATEWLMKWVPWPHGLNDPSLSAGSMDARVDANVAAQDAVAAKTWWTMSLAFLLGSNLVSNVPFILLVQHHMDTVADPKMAWTVLAMASTFAGNLTLLGSVANLIVAQAGQSVGGLGFWMYLRVGVPLAVLSTAMGTWWLVR